MGRNTPESPGNAKKRRRTSTTAAAAAAALPMSSPVPDLVPPPLSCYGDTVFASNPFDDASSGSAPMQIPNMGHMGHMGMMPRGMAPGMQGSMGPGPSGPMGPGGPMGHGPMGPGGPMGPMGPNSMNGPMGHGMGPGPNMVPGMPGGNNMGPGMGPGGNGMGPMMPRMSAPSSLSGSQNPMNSMANSMNPMTSMGSGMHEMNMPGMGPGGGPGMPGMGPGPGPSGMPPNSMPNSSRKVYPADQPMVFNPQNPNAPPIYPCGMCHKEVHENDQAILCESGCNFWFHRMCTGLIEQAYHLLIAEVYAEWVCDRCLSSKSIPLIKFKP